MLKRLRLLREEFGITQKQLADAIGVSQQSVNKYENHKIEPDIETLIKISDCFNTSVDYLIGHTDVHRKIEATTSCELNEEEAYMLVNYRKLTTKKKDSIKQIIELYSE